MKREIDLPERVVFTPTPEPLMQLCLECRREKCTGEKCDDYKNLERKIRMNVRRGRQRNSDAPAADSYMDVIIPAPKEKIAPEPSPVSKMELCRFPRLRTRLLHRRAG